MTLINLNEPNAQRAAELALETGRSAEDLVNEAFERFASEIESKGDAQSWKDEIMFGAGLWKDRNDLPDFDVIRKTLDRDVWSR